MTTPAPGAVDDLLHRQLTPKANSIATPGLYHLLSKEISFSNVRQWASTVDRSILSPRHHLPIFFLFWNEKLKMKLCFFSGKTLQLERSIKFITKHNFNASRSIKSEHVDS